MAKTLTNQHYVWAHYLEAWANPAFFCFRQSERKLFKTQPKVVANERNFYQTYRLSAEDLRYLSTIIDKAPLEITKKNNREFIHMFQRSFELREYISKLALPPTLKDGIERQLAEVDRTLGEQYHTSIENDAVVQLNELRCGESSFYDDDVACSRFLYFLATQYFRTPKIRNATGFGLGLEHNPKRTAPIEVHIYASNVGMSLYATRKKRRIIFLENKSHIPFITGDQPIVNVLNPLKADDVELYYPLSPKLAMLLTREHDEIDRSKRSLGEMAVETYNHLLYRVSVDQIYANDEIYLKGLASMPKDLQIDD